MNKIKFNFAVFYQKITLNHIKGANMLQNDTYNEILKNLRGKYHKQAITLHELADELGVSIHTLRLSIKNGKNVPNYKILGGGETRKRIIFAIHDVAKFLANTQQVL